MLDSLLGPKVAAELVDMVARLRCAAPVLSIRQETATAQSKAARNARFKGLRGVGSHRGTSCSTRLHFVRAWILRVGV